MKMPNFRLSTTQATVGLLGAILALLATAGLGLVVFKGIDTKQMIIPYHEHMGLSQYRRPLVYVGTAAAVVLGLTGGLLGFSSLGHQRNTKQGQSWMGMLLGAISVGVAPVMFYAWQKLSEAIIVAS